MQEINGRVAFITGGASGIGLGIAQALLSEGARIVLADIDEDRLHLAKEASTGDVLTVHLDISDRSAWKRAKAEAEAKFGPVDILCNNAGIAGDGHTLATMDPEAFDRMIRITLTGTFNGINTFAAGMMERGAGHVVNTASLAGLIHPPTIAAYCAAKAGLVALSECLLAEAGPRGVGVTVLCPGQVRTRIDETTRLAGSGRPPPEDLPSKSSRILEPGEVGRIVVRAIRENETYAITHSEYRKPFESRVTVILKAFDEAEKMLGGRE